MLYGHYEKAIDRESAHEQLASRAAGRSQVAADVDECAGGALLDQFLGDDVGREALADATEVDGRLGGNGEGGAVVVDAHPGAHSDP